MGNEKLFKEGFFSANRVKFSDERMGEQHSCNPGSDGPECVHTMDGFENTSASHYYAVYKTIDYLVIWEMNHDCNWRGHFV